MAGWEHRVLVDLSAAELDRSVEPFIDVVMVPWEVDELVSLELIRWLARLEGLLRIQKKIQSSQK